jgi:hypothetical protein
MKNWRCDWCYEVCSAKERPSKCPHCSRPRELTRVTTQLELKETAAASCNVESSALEEIGGINDPRQNVGLKVDGRGRGGGRKYFNSRAPLWKRQLSGVRAAAAVKRKREKE